ncbi:MAG: YebC/PmpR family DNA-binding transcriptional regulator [Oscillospiraceae bacterium]|jgi:YebC/PmpR family DNA-binding regulatory protein|nr:YebC/PmpR family DNA-binding transcriptional regulator [Oscillospiraceae bacterium]
MSGHSKWSTIKRKKEKIDGNRAKIFTKIGRELAVAVRQGGGPDPNCNFKLKDCIAKAKALNVPNENIERIIKKAYGDSENDKYEAITYEGYGPGGIAMIVETLTDNRNRTAGDLRHYFDKCGGNLGSSGCVSFLFERKGLLILERANLSADSVMENCLKAGAIDFEEDDEIFEIYTEPENFFQIKQDLEKEGYNFISAQVELIPTTYTNLKDEDSQIKMQKLLDMLENNDDVQNVWHNQFIES